MPQLYINNFQTQFIASVKAAAESGSPATELDYGVLRVSDGAAGVLLNPGPGNWYTLTAYKRSGSIESDYEIMKVTAVENSVIGECRLSVQRAQEGTASHSYTAGDLLELRVTAGAFGNYAQNTDAAMTNSRPPSGAAGGVLSGSYPNPAFAQAMATSAQLAEKVDKIAGKALSANDYTNADKAKLTGIAEQATANAPDSQLRERSTHAGVQAIATVTGLQAALDAKLADAPIDGKSYGRKDGAWTEAGDAASRGSLTITTSQNINKSIFGTATLVRVLLRAGAASGGAAVGTTTAFSFQADGGEGGEFVECLLRAADLPSSIEVIIGSGGASVTCTYLTANLTVIGKKGGDSVFNGSLRALGGVPAASTADIGKGTDKKNLSGKNGGSGAGSVADANSSVHGGGGGGSNNRPTPGTSQTAGRGGAGKMATVSGDKAEDGLAPSGGGGGIRLNTVGGFATSGAGAPGNCELTWW